ncbi:MAG: FAD-dependent oxidoreductase [Gammaproteobacteria bacterium]|nr:FAD-dependent oxidoreductase [Gammaproteobacteria bacterium]MBU1725670.1 FAD-dependent oxidoreductase [Gammaproteobacteria bacterium]MBU2003978.1 FAD-dependent oxidoreductase [Gammaproteobacteria bacterium]
MKHIIIGTGPAGVVAAETLRKRMPEADITLIGGEPERPYSRMAIPYHLMGNIAESGTYLRTAPNHFRNLDITLLHQHVNSIDAAAKSISLDNGNMLTFDKLLLATGSRPTRPPLEGMDLPGVVSCWTLADARKIIAGANAGDDVVLMGAGFIGCIILEALAQRGVNLTVVEMENRMVPRMMDDQSGGLLKQWCQSKGVTVLTSTRVKCITEEKGKLVVELEGREPLKVNLVICATGVRANMELADGLLDTNHGILVNERLQTSHPDIYAAGDVAEGKDFSTGGYSVQAIQPTAVEHGALAAINMAGGEDALHRGSINMNVLDTMGLISASFGLWQGVDGGDSAALDNPQRYRYINLQFEDDRLVGANALGLTQHVGVLRGLIQNQTRLGKWKHKLMEDPTRIMEAYLAQHVPRHGP